MEQEKKINETPLKRHQPSPVKSKKGWKEKTGTILPQMPSNQQMNRNLLKEPKTQIVNPIKTRSFYHKCTQQRGQVFNIENRKKIILKKIHFYLNDLSDENPQR